MIDRLVGVGAFQVRPQRDVILVHAKEEYPCQVLVALSPVFGEKFREGFFILCGDDLITGLSCALA